MTSGKIRGYPARVIHTLVWRNPANLPDSKGLERLQGQAEVWRIFKSRMDIKERLDYELLDMARANNLTEGEVLQWLTTPKAYGGGGQIGEIKRLRKANPTVKKWKPGNYTFMGSGLNIIENGIKELGLVMDKRVFDTSIQSLVKLKTRSEKRIVEVIKPDRYTDIVTNNMLRSLVFGPVVKHNYNSKKEVDLVGLIPTLENYVLMIGDWIRNKPKALIKDYYNNTGPVVFVDEYLDPGYKAYFSSALSKGMVSWAISKRRITTDIYRDISARWQMERAVDWINHIDFGA
jgi:hypothetical protein